jgi:hypothetical protein
MEKTKTDELKQIVYLYIKGEITIPEIYNWILCKDEYIQSIENIMNSYFAFYL